MENKVEVKEGNCLRTIVCGSRDTYMNHKRHEIKQWRSVDIAKDEGRHCVQLLSAACRGSPSFTRKSTAARSTLIFSLKSLFWISLLEEELMSRNRIRESSPNKNS